MAVEATGAKAATSPLRLSIDRDSGLLEVRLASSAVAIEARWGEPDGGELGDGVHVPSGVDAKHLALDRLRATPGWGDIPEGAGEDERRTLDRLAATPLWDCAVCIANLLVDEALCADGLRPQRIVELGAGLGLPGFLAARLWTEANVAVTECGDSLMDLLRRNLRINFPSVSGGRAKRPRVGRVVSAFDLAFGRAAADVALAGPLGEFGGPIDLILISDCFFYPWYGDTWTPLLASLMELCDMTTLVMLGTRHRSAGRVPEALSAMAQSPFHWRLLQQREVKCDVCEGEGYIDFECCWECEGVDSKEFEEVWLLGMSEAALKSWKSCNS